MRDHYYKNYRHVIIVLTFEYGFKYTGLGDNFEECFYKDSEYPETIFIHPMFCSYSMDSCRGVGGYKNRRHVIEFKSDYSNQREQEIAFLNLCGYLNYCTGKPKVILTEEDTKSILELLEEKRLELVALAVDPAIAIVSKKQISSLYGNLLSYCSAFSQAASLIK